MIHPSPEEYAAFKAIKDGGQSVYLRSYINRVQKELTDELIDARDATLDDLKAVQAFRKLTVELQERLTERDTMSSTPDQFS